MDKTLTVDFRPTASIEILRLRARLLRSVRQFFDERGFFEVETPVLSHDIVVDRYLEPISVVGDQIGVSAAAGKTFWLQTSPEFAMKRLIASGADAIYQIAHAFRAGEAGDFHNPEFSMLEWYRVGDNMDSGMDLLAELVEAILETKPCQRTSYHTAFGRHARIDVFSNDAEAFRAAAAEQDVDASALQGSADIDAWRNLLLTHIVEPCLGIACPEIVYDWPASQSALAVVRNESPPVAERFELYYQGVELANGYNELLDAEELLQRNRSINDQRAADGSNNLPEQSRLMDAMKTAMPACSGVAMGLDRLVMLATGCRSIKDVIAFPIDNA